MKSLLVVLAAFVCITAGQPETLAATSGDDIILADFESPDYGDWKITGEAFGRGPAQGTLPGQMKVTGHKGKRLVNSYHKRDASIGTLTSPPFTIERRYLNFLIGGGMHPGKTCVNLLVGGKTVRTATGPNDRPGGTERLDWHTWDLADLQGKTAVIQIVDQHTGGWGHINVDHFVQSKRVYQAKPARREISVSHRYLHLPIKNGSRQCWMSIEAQGRPTLEFQIELAEGEPDYWAFLDVGGYKGRKLSIEVDRLLPNSKGLAAIVQSDSVPDAKTLYSEKWRPQFHFTSRRGWLNDPNGLVYYDGQYHLFYQHNPYGVKWGNMTWGHAVSSDLIHWQELSDALHPDELGTIYSGSAVVDHNNTAGFQTGKEKPIVCFYTSAGRNIRKKVPYTQSTAYSNDSGRTLTKYQGNPVLGHIVAYNRDPNVIWHQPSNRWIMALFLDKRDFALFSSPDLKKWTRLCDIPDFGDRECPDFFELPVDGDKSNTRWVFWGASGRYLLGTFDGKRFEQQSGPHVGQYGPDDYAAQTYSDIPASDGRRIQIAWLRRGKYPGMAFNQQMSVPRVLSLRTTPDGVRLFIEPVEEIKKLRHREHTWKNLSFYENPKRLENLAGGPFGDLLDIEVTIEPGKAKTVGLDIRGFKVEYSPAEKRLTANGKSAPLQLVDGRVTLRILVDRTSVELFANSGRVQLASCFLCADKKKDIAVYSRGGKARIESLKIWELESAWSE